MPKKFYEIGPIFIKISELLIFPYNLMLLLFYNKRKIDTISITLLHLSWAALYKLQSELCQMCS
jgi:hypothetical protein